MQGGETHQHDVNARGRCVVVTPERAGVPEPVPHALADALAQHDAIIEHAPSPYHAITRIARPGAADAVTLVLVEPRRHARADSLALAAMTHAPDVAVWRYDPAHESPVAPYVPLKPGVVPDPLVPDAEDDAGDHDDDDAEDDAPGSPTGGEASLRMTEDENAPETARDEPDHTPLVSSEELSMLLGNDDEGERR